MPCDPTGSPELLMHVSLFSIRSAGSWFYSANGPCRVGENVFDSTRSNRYDSSSRMSTRSTHRKSIYVKLEKLSIICSWRLLNFSWFECDAYSKAAFIRGRHFFKIQFISSYGNWTFEFQKTETCFISCPKSRFLYLSQLLLQCIKWIKFIRFQCHCPLEGYKYFSLAQTWLHYCICFLSLLFE